MAKSRRGRGEGAIYRDGARWVGVLSLGCIAGKRRRRKVYGASKAEVVEALAAARGKAIHDPSRLTLAEYLADYLTGASAAAKKPITVQRYDCLCRHHITPFLGAYKLRDLAGAHIEAWYRDLAARGISNSLARLAGRVLTASLNYAVKLKLIAVNPCDDVPKPRAVRGELRILDPIQLQKLLAAARGRRGYAFLAVAIGTGLRRGELIGLQWQDFDAAAGALDVRRNLKTAAARRRVTLPSFAVHALDGLKLLPQGGPSSPIFTSRTGAPVDATAPAKYYLNPALRRAELPAIRFHDLRHSHASALLSAGHSLRAVSQRLGHSDPAFTLRVYAHVLPCDDAGLAVGINTLLKGS